MIIKIVMKIVKIVIVMECEDFRRNLCNLGILYDYKMYNDLESGNYDSTILLSRTYGCKFE